jgi:hypothetical protein
MSEGASAVAPACRRRRQASARREDQVEQDPLRIRRQPSVQRRVHDKLGGVHVSRAALRRGDSCRVWLLLSGYFA